jgi:hypothetical protein
MEQQNFSAQDSLQLIEAMISKAQNRFNENGHLYLLWGWTIFVCSIASFVSMYFFQSRYFNFIWMLTWVVVIYQTIYLIRRKKKSTVKTYTDEINGYVWIVFAIMGGLLSFVLVRAGQFELINTAILILYGMPTFLSGIILKFKPLVIGAVCCWVLAFISTMIPEVFNFLLLTVAVIAAWIVPGYLLRSRFKNQH